MKKRMIGLLLACAMLLTVVPMLPQEVHAATQSAYSPYAYIEYGYSSTVTCGTIRYISQVSSDSYFYSAYWPSSTFGNYVGASVECGTASMSMALSYIGVDKTPNDILTAYNGSTVFSVGWGGSTYYSISASALSTAMDNYINGNGKYSPPVIHIPGYSSAGHYVVVVGKISSNTYQILDSWQRALTSMTVSGSSATYTVYGSTIYDTIDQIHQWYNASASVDYASTCESYPSYCQIETTRSTPVNSQPCAAGSNNSTTIETAASGATYTAIGLYRNSGGNLWYQVTSTSGQTGYLYAGHVSYVKQLTTDIKLSNASYPNGHVAGNSFIVNGTISSSYNYLTSAAVYVHSGFGTSGTKMTGTSTTVNGKSFALAYSTLDAGTAFGTLSAGKYTYAIYASYQNYYASDATTLASNTGTVTLMDEYFVVVSSAVDQSSCSHSYSTTTKQEATCTASGTAVKSCSKCGLVTETTVAALGHSYGSWTTVNATCTTDGSKTRTCSTCGNVETQTIAAGGHDYNLVTHAATCSEYEIYEYTCGTCGDNYKLDAGELASGWIDYLPEGLDSSLFNSKTQYRYSDYETKTSYETSLSGYTLKSSAWEESGTTTVEYVNSWPSGFSTSSSLYSTYNKKSSKVTASETTTTKITVNSDAIVGYLYYHWCYSGSYYSVESKSGSYTTFHAFYSTTDPSDCTNYDSSDGSYYYPNSSCCSNSEWYWPVAVYAQKSTSYKKLYTYERWTDYTDWSDTAVTASTTRKVETRSVYQLKEAALGNHSWNSGAVTTTPTCTSAGVRTYTCTACGVTKTETVSTSGHNYNAVVTAPTCTAQGYTTHTCTVCGDSYIDSYVGATGHSYNAVVTAPTCTAQGYTTHTCSTCGSNYVDAYVNATGHNWADGVCSGCGEICEHNSYVNGACTSCGKALIEPDSATLSLEGEVFYNIYFTVDDASSVKELGLITFNTEPTEGTIDNADCVLPGAEYNSTTNQYTAHTMGVPAKKLGDDLYIRVYAQMKDGTYVYSRMFSYSAKTYAYKKLSSTTTSQDLKNLVVAMLNYGAEAQLAFNYKTDNLMNADLTADQKASIATYTSDMMASRTLADSVKAAKFTNSGEFSYRSATMILDGALAINYRFIPTNTPDSGVTLYYWDTATYNSVNVMTKDNATGSISMELIEGYYTWAYTGLAAKELDETIYVVAVYTSGGVEYTTEVIAYSLATYCNGASAKNNAYKALGEATVVYSNYAKIYFQNK